MGDQRKLVKLLVLTALNAKDLQSACSAFREDLQAGHPGKKLKNKQLKAVLDQLVERVPALQGQRRGSGFARADTGTAGGPRCS